MTTCDEGEGGVNFSLKRVTSWTAPRTTKAKKMDFDENKINFGHNIEDDDENCRRHENYEENVNNENDDHKTLRIQNTLFDISSPKLLYSLRQSISSPCIRIFHVHNFKAYV